MNIIGESLWVKGRHFKQSPRWQSFMLVRNNDQRWLWARHVRIDGRGLSLAERTREFLLREAGGR